MTTIYSDASPAPADSRLTGEVRRPTRRPSTQTTAGGGPGLDRTDG